MKKLFRYFPEGSPVYIVLHAQYRRSRGRRPVATSATQRNPREALREAEQKLDGGVVITLAKPCTMRLISIVLERLNLRLPTVEEAKALFQKKEKEEASAPYLEYDPSNPGQRWLDDWNPRNGWFNDKFVFSH